ncbi:MAG: T9SS type A sorting domain-containing protein [Saprospiraceae bacterium]|nr:T9SS type A sorting domain-containing protein [Saprospiraceae bacterium]
MDNNNNNLQDANDLGLNGILVELYRVGNPVPVQTMLTINDPRAGREGMAGYYMFEVCDLGDYTIRVKPDMNVYQYVNPNQGTNDAIDSDIIDFINQSTLIFTVSYAAQITDIDAGVKLRPLPVTLKSFTGRWNTKDDVNELEWVTVSETNNDYFEVERSFKGSEFEVIAKVAGAGNSTKTLVYGIEDEDILVNGVYTYRLKQVDFDGRETNYGPVEIKVERALEGGNIKVYPNPTRGAFNVEIEATSGQSIKADLYDSTGKLISSQMVDKVSEGELIRYQNDNLNLDKGMYYIVINIDGVIISKPLIIIE